jgi:hypothetical protein
MTYRLMGRMKNTQPDSSQLIYGPAIPLFNSGPWNSDLHPRDDIGRFTATGGNSSPITGGNPPHPTYFSDLHSQESKERLATRTGYSGTITGADVLPQATLPTSISLPRPKPREAVYRALNLPLNPNTDRNNGSSRNPYISHYGGDWDPNKDSNTNPPPGSGRKPRGNHDNDLNANSLAISPDVAAANYLVKGKGVYINGLYLAVSIQNIMLGIENFPRLKRGARREFIAHQ